MRQYDACAVKESGTLFCWGDGRQQQLGEIKSDDTLRPSQVGSDSDWLDVGVASDHTCALKQEGSLYCWGRGEWLGTEGLDDTPSPIRVGDASEWSAFTLGFAHTCGLGQGFCGIPPHLCHKGGPDSVLLGARHGCRRQRQPRSSHALAHWSCRQLDRRRRGQLPHVRCENSRRRALLGRQLRRPCTGDPHAGPSAGEYGRA